MGLSHAIKPNRKCWKSIMCNLFIVSGDCHCTALANWNFGIGPSRITPNHCDAAIAIVEWTRTNAVWYSVLVTTFSPDATVLVASWKRCGTGQMPSQWFASPLGVRLVGFSFWGENVHFENRFNYTHFCKQLESFCRKYVYIYIPRIQYNVPQVVLHLCYERNAHALFHRSHAKLRQTLQRKIRFVPYRQYRLVTLLYGGCLSFPIHLWQILHTCFVERGESTGILDALHEHTKQWMHKKNHKRWLFLGFSQNADFHPIQRLTKEAQIVLLDLNYFECKRYLIPERHISSISNTLKSIESWSR